MGTSTRPSALFLTPEAPYPLAGGGALRSASLLEYLARRYCVDAIVFRQPGASNPAAAIPIGLIQDALVLDLPFHSRRPLARLIRNLDRCRRGAPPLNDRFAGFGAQIGRFLLGRQYDLALIEHFWCAPYWEQVAPRSARTVLDLHNIESVLLGRRAAMQGWAAAGLLRRFETAARSLERQWLPRFTSLLVPSGADAAFISHQQVIVYPNALPLLHAPEVRQEHVIAFSGNLEYDPNVDAVRYFRDQIWPLLRRRWPELVWRLIGKNPETVARLLGGDSRIQLTGPVDNAVEALAAAQVALVPLRAGSGTRVKILEAWAAARPVVSTTLGAEGLSAIDGEHLILADKPEQFAAAVSALLDSAELRERLGRAGRRLYEREYTWEAAWRALAEAEI